MLVLDEVFEVGSSAFCIDELKASYAAVVGEDGIVRVSVGEVEAAAEAVFTAVEFGVVLKGGADEEVVGQLIDDSEV